MKKLTFAKSCKELEVYIASFRLQQAVFKLTKNFPSEERFSLTDQIRRSSRSIGANISEAWAKRRYLPHFVSKLTDSDGELQETLHWLRTALACNYVSVEDSNSLANYAEEIGKMLGSMIAKPEKFCPNAI